MEKLVLLSALLLTLLIELCSAAGAYTQKGGVIRKQPEDLRSIQEFGQVNEVCLMTRYNKSPFLGSICQKSRNYHAIVGRTRRHGRRMAKARSA